MLDVGIITAHLSGDFCSTEPRLHIHPVRVQLHKRLLGRLNNSARTQIPGRTVQLLWPVDLLGVAECHFLQITISINPAVCSINFSLCPPLNDVPLEPPFALWESGIWCGRPGAVHWKSDTMMICFWPFSRTKIFHLQRKSNSSPRAFLPDSHLFAPIRLCGAFKKKKKKDALRVTNGIKCPRAHQRKTTADVSPPRNKHVTETDVHIFCRGDVVGLDGDVWMRRGTRPGGRWYIELPTVSLWRPRFRALPQQTPFLSFGLFVFSCCPLMCLETHQTHKICVILVTLVEISCSALLYFYPKLP